jgi:hypothetical protein|nr:MAG TPA: hypothetical protein [Caudoviricetes sp.]DAG17392.1 MAG TPA: hypothetical protein [Caudoviricetes sp.]DAU43267.1 MAG TPA: hypothetical protein [Caudoviricetes sp.]
MLKIYELSRFDAMTLRISYCGQVIMASFKGGDQRRNRARLVTDSLFVQDALEHDPRFGSLYILKKSYSDSTKDVEARIANEKTKTRKITKVKSVNDALLYFTQLGANVTGEGDLKTLMEQYNVEFPNLRY